MQSSAQAEHDPTAIDDTQESNGAALLARWSAPFRAVALLLVLCGGLFFVNLGGYPLYTKGEAREAVTVLAMVRGAGVILPMRAGIEVPSKPPMMHWLAAAISKAAGDVSELNVRLPSAVLGTGAVLLCYAYIGRLIAAQAGLCAAILLASSVQFIQAATGARVDMTLTFFMELAFFEFLALAQGASTRWWLFYGAMAAAVLSKGPVGAALPIAVGLGFIVLERRWSLVAVLRPGYGLALLVVLAGWWYAAALAIGGWAFFRKQILAENLFTFLHSRELSGGHAHPFYYTELALLAGFMPWTLLLPGTVKYFARARAWRQPGTRYLAIWAGLVLVFYNLAHSKRGVYLLAMYPALAGMTGLYVRELIEGRERLYGLFQRLAGWVITAGAACALVVAAVVAVLPASANRLGARMGLHSETLLPLLRSALASHFAVAIVIVVALSALGWWLTCKALAPWKLIAGGAAAITLSVIAANLFVVPALAESLSLKQFTAQAMATIGNAPVAYIGGINYDVAFYSGRTIPVATKIDEAGPTYYLAWKQIYDALPAPQRAALTPVAKSGPTELDGSGGLILLRNSGADKGTASGHGAGAAALHRGGESGHYVGRSAAQADIAGAGDFALIQVDFEHHAAPLADFQR